MEYSAYAITIRPADGITDDQIQAVTKFIISRCDYYVIVTEKTGAARHLHAGLFLKKPVQKKVINVRLRELKCFKALSNSEKYVMNKGTKIMYNRDFIDEYLTKGDDTEIIDINAPPEDCSDYFPPPEEQDRAMRSARINTAKNAKLQELEELFLEHGPPHMSSFKVAKNFLADMMFNKRLIKGYKDMRELNATATMFMHYVLKTTDLHAHECAQATLTATMPRV